MLHNAENLPKEGENQVVEKVQQSNDQDDADMLDIAASETGDMPPQNDDSFDNLPREDDEQE